MPNKQNTQEAAATATAAHQFTLEGTEIKTILRAEADRLTPDATLEILLSIVEATGTEENESCNNFDKILWSIRCGYLIGFQKALECYSECIKQQLQKA